VADYAAPADEKLAPHWWWGAGLPGVGFSEAFAGGLGQGVWGGGGGGGGAQACGLGAFVLVGLADEPPACRTFAPWSTGPTRSNSDGHRRARRWRSRVVHSVGGALGSFLSACGG